MLKVLALVAVIIVGFVLLHAVAKLVLWLVLGAALLFIGHAAYRKLAGRS